MDGDREQYPISVKDLHKSFGAQTVLNGIALDVHEGETLAVLGRSGTGKSVLLKLLIGLQSPDSGSVSIRGEDVTNAGIETLAQIRKRIGFLFQQAALYDSLTVEENVLFPMRRHDKQSDEDRKKHAQDLLARVGIKDGLDKMPSEISGGTQKRVGLARALALDPEILLFDEPTAGLDPITAAEISNLILDLKKQRGLTGVVVTHDIRGARIFADRVVLLHEGKIVAEGTFAEIQKSEDAFVKQFLENGS